MEVAESLLGGVVATATILQVGVEVEVAMQQESSHKQALLILILPEMHSAARQQPLVDMV